VIFVSLVMDNIGTFYGRHEIDLHTDDDARPIVLIGALNGSGKTTILEALQLGLYGRRAKSLFRIKGSYDEYIRKLVNRNAAPKAGARIELVYQHEEAGKTMQYRLVRSWSFRTKQPIETLDLYIDGKYDSVMSDNWDEEVERLIPRNLAHLFFFDGERIETLADPDKSAEILRTGIHSLLGIDLVDQLHLDLNIYRRRLKKSAATPAELANISELEAKIDYHNEKRLEIDEELSRLRNDISAAKSALRLAKDRFEQHGGRVYENRSQIEKDRIENSASLTQIDNSLRELCTHSLPLCIMPEQLNDLLTTVILERKSIDAAKLLKGLSKRDNQFVSWLESKIGKSGTLLKDVRAYLDDDKDQYEQAASLAPVIEIEDTAFAQLNALSHTALATEQDKCESLLAQRREISDRIDSIDRSLEMMPEESVIRMYLESKTNAEAKCVLLSRQLEQLEEQFKQTKYVISITERDRDRILADVKQSELTNEKHQRLADYSAKVQHTLDQLRRRTLVSHLATLEAHIADAFQRLLRKKSLIDSVSINPDTFVVTLHSKNGVSLTPQLLSAGERQILAIALLWGLGRASGRRIPIVIDTPLGRLDSVHRKHLVKEYFPEASHQVILLSTDEEIDEELSADLDDSIAYRYLLNYDDKSESTSVERGYFW